MIRKKVITVFLMLVLALQLLPIRQAVRYFFVDNTLIEEMTHASKSATQNFRLIEEDNHFLTESLQYSPGFFLLPGGLSLSYQEMLPAYHSADIHTPPPNLIS